MSKQTNLLNVYLLMILLISGSSIAGELDRIVKDYSGSSKASKVDRSVEDYFGTIQSIGSLNTVGKKALQNGDYNTALSAANKILHLSREKFGSHHRETIKSLNSIGIIYILKDRPEIAQYVYEIVLRKSREEKNQNQSVFLAGLNNLALTYVTQQRYIEALPLFEEALSMSQDILKQNHLHTIMTQNNLASTYSSLGRYEEAEQLLIQVMNIFRSRKTQKKDSRYRRVTLNNLAYLYIATGRFEDAGVLFEKMQRTFNNEELREVTEGKTSPFISYSISDGIGPPIDCSNFNGGVGPFNPDPTTGGDMAQCGPFGTRNTFGMWNDWGDGGGGGDVGCPACPPCTFCGGGGPNPEPEDPGCNESDIDCLQDEVDFACDDCRLQEMEDTNKCFINFSPRPVQPAPPFNPSPTPTPIIITRGMSSLLLVDMVATDVIELRNAMESITLPPPLPNCSPGLRNRPCAVNPQVTLQRCLANAAKKLKDCEFKASNNKHNLTCSYTYPGF